MYDLEKDSNNTLCQDAVKEDMNNVRIAFKILNSDKAIPPIYQDITCHMIFNVKMEGF
jgi:hypothetical protein